MHQQYYDFNIVSEPYAKTKCAKLIVHVECNLDETESDAFVFGAELWRFISSLIYLFSHTLPFKKKNNTREQENPELSDQKLNYLK